MVDELVVVEKKGWLDRLPIIGALRRKARENILADQKRLRDQDALVRSQAKLLDDVNRLVQLLNGMSNSLSIPNLLDDFEALEMPEASSGVELYRKYFSVLKSKHEAFLDYLHVLEGRKVEMNNRVVQFKEEVEKLESFLGVLRSRRVQKIKDILNYEMGVRTDPGVKKKYRAKLGELAVIESAIVSLSDKNDKVLKDLGDLLTQKCFELHGMLGDIGKFDYESFFGEVSAFLDKVNAVHYDEYVSDTENLGKLKQGAIDLESERKVLLAKSKEVLGWVKKSREVCVEAKALVENELPKFKRVRRSYAVQRNKLIKFIKDLKKEALVPNISHYEHLYDYIINLTEHFRKLCQVYRRHGNHEIFLKDKMLTQQVEGDNEDNSVWKGSRIKVDFRKPFSNYNIMMGEAFNTIEKKYNLVYLELVSLDPEKADQLKQSFDRIYYVKDIVCSKFYQDINEFRRRDERFMYLDQHNWEYHLAFLFAERMFEEKKGNNTWEKLLGIDGLLGKYLEVLKAEKEEFLSLLKE